MITRRDALNALYPQNFQTLTVDGTVRSLDLDKLRICQAVEIRAEAAPMRYRVDGSDPDANTGAMLFDGDVRQFSVQEAMRFRAIRVGSTNGVISATFYHVA